MDPLQHGRRPVAAMAVGGSLLAAAVCPGRSGAVGEGDLRAEIDALKARVEAQDQEIARLRAERGDGWLAAERAEQIKGLIEDVLADADTRASLLADGMTAGHDGRSFFLASADGKYRMNISGIMQMRYIANSRDGAPDDLESGFQLRRLKVKFEGHVISPQILYALQLAANRDTGEVEVDLATIGYQLADGLRVEAGRYKGPFLHEEFITSASRQLTVERSLVNAIFTANYVEGVKLEASAGERTRLYLSIDDGLRSGDPGGTGGDFANDTTDFAVTARADARLAGDWNQIRDFSAWSGEPTGLFVGGAVHYELAETGDMQLAAPGVDSFVSYTLDGSLEASGLNLYGAFIGRHVELVDTAAAGTFDDFAALVQGGYMVLPDRFEPFVRYEWIGPDGDTGFDEMNLITIGANYYFHKHAAKLTADVIWALDELNGFAFTSPTSRTGLGLLPDAPDQSDQVVLRVQVQMLF